VMPLAGIPVRVEGDAPGAFPRGSATNGC